MTAFEPLARQVEHAATSAARQLGARGWMLPLLARAPQHLLTHLAVEAEPHLLGWADADALSLAAEFDDLSGGTL